MEYQIQITCDGELVAQDTFAIEANVTDPNGRYTLSTADVKTKQSTFERAMEFACQAHANVGYVRELVASQSATSVARRLEKQAAKAAEKAAELAAKAAQAAQAAQPNAE